MKTNKSHFKNETHRPKQPVLLAVENPSNLAVHPGQLHPGFKRCSLGPNRRGVGTALSYLMKKSSHISRVDTVDKSVDD